MMTEGRIGLLALAGLVGVGLVAGGGGTARAEVQFDDVRLSVTDTQALSEPETGEVDQSLLEGLEEPSAALLDAAPDELMAANENAGRRLDSQVPAEPWLADVATPPFLVVYPSIQQGVAIKEWRFSIMDDAGHTLWTMQSRGSIPEVLRWDGKVSQGGMLDVEMPFFYTLGAMDMGGNPIFLSGPSQSLSTLAFQESNRLVIRLSSGKLFRSGKDTMLSEGGEALLRESMDLIAKGRYRTFQVTACAATDKLGNLQAEQVVNFCMRRFTLPRNVFTIQPRSVNDRFKIEILCKP